MTHTGGRVFAHTSRITNHTRLTQFRDYSPPGTSHSRHNGTVPHPLGGLRPEDHSFPTDLRTPGLENNTKGARYKGPDIWGLRCICRPLTVPRPNCVPPVPPIRNLVEPLCHVLEEVSGRDSLGNAS